MGDRRFQGAQRGRGSERSSPRERGPSEHFVTRATTAVAILCLGFLLLWSTYRATHILLVIFGGVVMAVLFHTMASPLVRFARMPTWAAVTTALLIVLGLFALGGWMMAAPVSQQFEELTVRLPEA